MTKTILLTGATDGIGLETARKLQQQGHQLIIHGRNADKLSKVAAELNALPHSSKVATIVADLSSLQAVQTMADTLKASYNRIDILINNAGIFRTAEQITAEQLDIRFAVNTLAPYILTRELLPLIPADGRIVNLSSAAQAPVDLQALQGQKQLDDEFAAYAQSKLAITAWSRHIATSVLPAIIAVNPGSLLASKMVKEGFGIAGNDLSIGADILIEAALGEAFASASGKYFDNDNGQFASPHPAGCDTTQNAVLITTMDAIIARKLNL